MKLIQEKLVIEEYIHPYYEKVNPILHSHILSLPNDSDHPYNVQAKMTARNLQSKELDKLLKAAGKDGYQSSADLAVVLANIHDQVYPWITKGEYSKKTRHELAWDFVKDSLTTVLSLPFNALNFFIALVISAVFIDVLIPAAFKL